MITKISRIHKKMILDYSGMIPLKDQPKKAKELNDAFDLFRRGFIEEFDKAYNTIVLRKVETGDDSGEMMYKISEIISSNLDMQESTKLNNLADFYKGKHEDMLKEARAEAKKQVDKYRGDLVTYEIKTPKSTLNIKEIVCPEFPDLLQLASARINIMMVGPSGCGKTHIAGQVAKSLSLDYASQSCSAGMSESQLSGWLLPIDGGNFEYVASEFIRIYENGGVFLFDEMDAADPNVLIFINQALANSQFSLPQRFNNTTVKKHPDFVAMAACNTMGGGADGMYHARNALDASTVDRFKIGMIGINYSRKVEACLTDEEVYNWGRSIRKAISSSGLRKIMSTRVMIDASKMKSCGWSLNRIEKAYLLDWSEEEKRVLNTERKLAGDES